MATVASSALRRASLAVPAMAVAARVSSKSTAAAGLMQAAAVASKGSRSFASAANSVSKVSSTARNCVIAVTESTSGNNQRMRFALGSGGLLVAAAATLAAATDSDVHAETRSDGDMILFSGNANPELATEIATLLGSELGNITVARFADGEVNVQVSCGRAMRNTPTCRVHDCDAYTPAS